MTLVIGVGNPERGDDGVGPVIASRVAALGLPGVRVVPAAEPSRLLDLWEGESDVVVVDAVRGVADARGRVVIIDADEQPLPTWAGPGGTHGFGVAAAVELGRAVGRLPRRVVVVGVVGRHFEDGAELSPEVAAAVDVAVGAVRERALARPGPCGQASARQALSKPIPEGSG